VSTQVQTRYIIQWRKRERETGGEGNRKRSKKTGGVRGSTSDVKFMYIKQDGI